MTYVRETCGCCGESQSPQGGAAGLPGSHPAVRVIIQGLGSRPEVGVIRVPPSPWW